MAKAVDTPEAEALKRIEKAIQAYEDADFPLSQIDAYRKLVKEALALRAAVSSQVAGEPITKRVRVDVEEDESRMTDDDFNNKYSHP